MEESVGSLYFQACLEIISYSLYENKRKKIETIDAIDPACFYLNHSNIRISEVAHYNIVIFWELSALVGKQIIFEMVCKS